MAEARQVGLRGLLPQRQGAARFPIPWAHELLAVPLPDPSYPIDVTHGAPAGPMWGNDQKGDCGEAGELFLDLVGSYRAGVAPAEVTDAGAIAEYLAYTGGEDTGVVLADFLLWLYRQGRIKAFAPVPHTDRATCDALMQLTGQPLYCGGSLFPNSEEQFGAGQPWDPQGLAPDQQLGHCIDKCKADGAGRETWRTWGAFQEAVVAFGDGYLQEAWVVVTTDEQLALFTPALLAVIDQLGGTGGQPAPAPEPPPAPVPPQPGPPTPTPPGPVPPSPGPGCWPASAGPLLSSTTVQWLESTTLRTIGTFLVAFLAVVAGAGSSLFTASTLQAAASAGIVAGAAVLEGLVANVITPGSPSAVHAYRTRAQARRTREAMARHHHRCRP